MSQNFDIGLGYFFMLCKKNIFSLFYMFHLIKYEPGDKTKI